MRPIRCCWMTCLRTYPVYTVVAEKLHAISLLGMTNSRVKGYLDLSVLLERNTLDADFCWPKRSRAPSSGAAWQYLPICRSA